MSDQNSNQKKIYVVLGIARSGTSVITRALNVLGVDLGNHLNPSNKWNPKGFWEDKDIVYNINRKVFEKLNYEHGVFRDLYREDILKNETEDLKQLARDLLKSRMQETRQWGFKDPNTVRVLPFWQNIFSELQLSDHYIIALRNPLESAESYQNKSFGCNYEKTLYMWLLHLLPAVEQTHGKKRIVVHYDLMLKNPKLQLERFQNKMDFEKISEEKIDQYINGFLDRKLRHAEYDENDLRMHPASSVVPLCFKAYHLLLKLARDEMADDEKFKAEWQQLMNEFDTYYPLYVYMDQLQEKNMFLRKSLHRVHRSFMWRLMKPVRKVKDFLRVRRKQLKLNKEAHLNQLF